jgi:hypothetical protein
VDKSVVEIRIVIEKGLICGLHATDEPKFTMAEVSAVSRRVPFHTSGCGRIDVDQKVEV